MLRTFQMPLVHQKRHCTLRTILYGDVSVILFNIKKPLKPLIVQNTVKYVYQYNLIACLVIVHILSLQIFFFKINFFKIQSQSNSLDPNCLQRVDVSGITESVKVYI